MDGTITRLDDQALPDGRRVAVFRLAHGALSVTLTDYGARITSCRLHGVEVMLGHDRIADYVGERGCLGATVGRYANRIAGGRFVLDGTAYAIPCNNGANALHGGPVGFDRAIWQVEAAEASGVTLSHTSPDGDQGFPGRLEVTLRYTLDADGTLGIACAARADRATVLNLTNHSYFNLAGGGDILDHLCEIAADAFAPVDATLIPTGELRVVAGTPFDFRNPLRVGARIGAADEQLRIGGGYDHNFVLRAASEPDGLRFAARLTAPSGERMLEVWTTEPGMQFYTGNHLGAAQRGRMDGTLFPHAGLCLETQHFPDAPNHPHFPSTVLRPDKKFESRTLYRFIAPHK